MVGCSVSSAGGGCAPGTAWSRCVECQSLLVSSMRSPSSSESSCTPRRRTHCPRPPRRASSSGSPCRIGATIHGKCSLLARPGPTIPPFPPRLVAERRSRLGPSVADHGPRTRGAAQAHRLASRLRGSAPVEARGIAALKDLLTDRGGPVYTPGDPNTLERKLELIDQWLDVQSEQARSPSSREAYAKCTEVLSRRG